MLLPYYFFDPGSPQVSHVFIVGFVIYYVIFNWERMFYGVMGSPYAMYFLAYVASINTYYMLYFTDITFYLYTLYYGFNILIFYLTRQLIQDNQLSMDVLAKSIIGTLLLQLVLALIFLDIDVLERQKLFFNNENQLGYFSLLLSTLYFIIEDRIAHSKNIKIIYGLLVYGLSLISIVLSAYRS